MYGQTYRHMDIQPERQMDIQPERQMDICTKISNYRILSLLKSYPSLLNREMEICEISSPSITRDLFFLPVLGQVVVATFILAALNKIDK